MHEVESADFVVIGGGPAGAAAAIGLARQGARVILFERTRSTGFKPGEIVSAAIQRPMRELGVWDEFLKMQPLRLAGTVSIWDSGEASETPSICNPWGAGFMLDRSAFESYLLCAAAQFGVHVIRAPDAFELGHAVRGRRSVTWCQDGRAFRARPVVFIETTGRAGGVASPNRRQRYDDLVAMLCYTKTGHEGRDMRLHIEATEDGWWYAASLPDGISVAAFMTDADHVPRGVDARRTFVVARLQATILIRNHVGSATIDDIRVAPANSSIRLNLTGSDWVAVGDAAAAYDPLVGLGVVAALNKGAAIAQLLLREPSTIAAADRYADLERTAFENYLIGRRKIYSLQRRWKDQPFWKQRSSEHGHPSRHAMKEAEKF